MTELEIVKEAEKAAQDDFLAACVELLAAAHLVGESAEAVKHAGGQPVEILHLAEVVNACRQLITRADHQARLVAGTASKPANPRKLGPTYGLK